MQIYTAQFFLQEVVSRLAEEITETLFLGLLLLLLLFFLRRLALSGSAVARASGRGSRCVCIRVGNAVLEFINGLPAVLRSQGDANNFLVGVYEGVGDGG